LQELTAKILSELLTGCMVSGIGMILLRPEWIVTLIG